MKSDIKKLTFNDRLPFGFKIITVNHQYARAKANLSAPHRAAFYVIIWFKTGTPVHVVDFRPVAIRPDSFLFIRKDAVQLFDQYNVFNADVLIFTDNFFCNTDSDQQFLQHISLFNNLTGSGDIGVIPATNLLRELWGLMQSEEKSPVDDFQSLLLKNYLFNFIMLADRDRQKAGFRPIQRGRLLEYLISFQDYLEKNFIKEKSVNFYAQKLCISNKVLNHTVQTSTGRSPKQLIDERLILEAKRLLVHSNDSVKMIGLNLSFDEPTNFNKFFKKHTGKTPAEFRGEYLSYNRVVANVSS